jgi:hypothetical protein
VLIDRIWQNANTEKTIVTKVIKQFFCDTHDKPKGHDHRTTMTLATEMLFFVSLLREQSL